MIRKLLREYFMLPRGEQRAMILVSALLVLSLGGRIAVQMLPAREPPGMEQFQQEARRIMQAMAEADSIQKAKNEPQPRRHFTSYKRRPHPISINLNTADSVTLLPLPGIGPVLAGRVIKYRHLLGGYASVYQLAEVYGLDTGTLAGIAPLILVDTSKITRLKLNSATFRDLLKHPYLEYEDVLALVKYRDVVGIIGSAEELKQNAILADSTYGRIRPYME